MQIKFQKMQQTEHLWVLPLLPMILTPQIKSPIRFPTMPVEHLQSMQATGEVSVADTDLIDYESDQSLEIEVTAESTDGSSTTQVYTINVLDFNEFAITQVTDSDTGANEVSEAALAGTVVGLTAFAEDADLSANVTYYITNDPSGAFEIDETTGVVTVSDYWSSRF